MSIAVLSLIDVALLGHNVIPPLADAAFIEDVALLSLAHVACLNCVADAGLADADTCENRALLFACLLCSSDCCCSVSSAIHSGRCLTISSISACIFRKHSMKCTVICLMYACSNSALKRWIFVEKSVRCVNLGNNIQCGSTAIFGGVVCHFMIF